MIIITHIVGVKEIYQLVRIHVVFWEVLGYSVTQDVPMNPV